MKKKIRKKLSRASLPLAQSQIDQLADEIADKCMILNPKQFELHISLLKKSYPSYIFNQAMKAAQLRINSILRIKLKKTFDLMQQNSDR